MRFTEIKLKLLSKSLILNIIYLKTEKNVYIRLNDPFLYKNTLIIIYCGKLFNHL